MDQDGAGDGGVVTDGAVGRHRASGRTQKTYEELAGRGVDFLQKPATQAWGKFARFVDPDGNKFVISDAA